MSIVKTAFFAASLALVASAANAQGREDLLSGFHGNTIQSTGPYIALPPEARAAFARAGTVRMAPTNPLNDMFHGLAVR